MNTPNFKKETAHKIFEKHQEVIIDLSNANLVGTDREGKDIKYSEDLKLASLKENHDYKDILQKAILCIYEVRNNLFHKGKVLDLIADSSTLLRDVIRGYLIDYVAN